VGEGIAPCAGKVEQNKFRKNLKKELDKSGEMW